MEKIWSEALGSEYPSGLEHYGYLTKTDLNKIADLLQLEGSDIFLDIGCGKGGPGFKLAEGSGAKYLGIDIVPEAIDQAREFASRFDLEREALFSVGEFYNIPLEDALVDHVISIDALWAATDKVFALKEVGRVLKPGGRFVFTHWDLKTQDPLPYFEASGLSLISRSETPKWLSFQTKVYEGILKYQDDLLAEMGDGANMLIYEAGASMPHLALSTRMLYCMEKA